ncbi:MAG: glycosyltransferase [Flavobacteriaceae bacterium]|nr:glycosyltransferase [Flavobacteriaceae bacterium]
MSVAIVLIGFCYAALILRFTRAFDALSVFRFTQKPPKQKFSIIIPFRNEAHNLPSLLHSISTLDYPKHQFEVVLVDDQSHDNSRAVIENFAKNHQDLNLHILNNKRFSNSPKKDAISLAIKHIKYNWIITTDADCLLPELWLQTYDNFIALQDVEMIVAPVTYSANGTWFEQFQLIDFLSLQSATIAGFGLQKPFLCNGANLCYKASLFEALSGFEGNNQIASGDDIFLMEKVLQVYPDKLQYLKSLDATVHTQTQDSLQALIQQRVRWAAKSKHYTNEFAKWVGLLILLMNATLLLNFSLAISNHLSWIYVILPLGMKMLIDYRFITKSVHFFNQTICLKHYFTSSLLYPVFSVYVVFHSIVFSYKWKGRSFKK